MLVGRSHECDFPASLSDIPVLTASRTHAPATSDRPWHDIDTQVREALSQGSSLYSLDTQLLARLRPDVILTQNLCDVCSIDLAQVQRTARSLAHPCEVVSLDATTIEGVFDDLLRVGKAVGSEASASTAVVRLRERMFEASEFVNPYADAPPLALLEWTDPLFCAGHWSVQLIERAGASHPWNPTRIRDTAGAAMGPQQGERIAGKSVRIEASQVQEHEPFWVVVAPCGLSLAQSRQAALGLLAQPWFASLRAVREGRAFVVDGNQWFNRPGPRIVDTYEWLVSTLQGVRVGTPAPEAIVMPLRA